MSKGARLRAQKAQQEPMIAFVPGLTVDDPDAIHAMEAQTHDGLIEMTGKLRRSGVRWRHVHGRAEAEEVLTSMYAGDPSRWPDVQRVYFPFLAEHGDRSVMVVAECDAVVRP